MDSGSCEGDSNSATKDPEIVSDVCGMVEWSRPGKMFTMTLHYRNDEDCYVVLKNPGFMPAFVQSDDFHVSTI